MCVYCCCLSSRLWELGNEFQKHTWKVRVGVKTEVHGIPYTPVSSLPPQQGWRTEGQEEAPWTVRPWFARVPRGGLPEAQQHAAALPRREVRWPRAHLLLSRGPQTLQGFVSTVSPPLPWVCKIVKIVRHCSVSFLFPHVQTCINQDIFSLEDSVILSSSTDSYKFSQQILAPVSQLALAHKKFFFN